MENVLLDKNFLKTASAESVKTKIKQGADIEGENKYGQTPIMLAARYSTNPEVVTTLIDEGADWRTAARNGKRAWDGLQANPRLSKNTKLIELLKPAYLKV